MRASLFLFIVFSINLYSISISPEFGMLINLGASQTFTSTDVRLKKSDTHYYKWGPYYVYYDTIKGNISIDYEAIFQVGFGYNINNSFATKITSLLQLGYSTDFINTKYESIGGYTYTDTILLHSFILGIVEKISFNNFSIGIGGGVLFPISGFGNSSNDRNDNTSLVMPEKNKLSYYDIKRLFITPISPYIKIIFEYAFKPFKVDNSDIGFILGLYINYNFGMKYDVSVLNEYTHKSPLAISFNDIYKKYDYSNLDFGITFGVFLRPII